MLTSYDIEKIWKVVTPILCVFMMWNPSIRMLVLLQDSYFDFVEYIKNIFKKAQYEFKSIGYYAILLIPYVVAYYINVDAYRFLVVCSISLFYILVSFVRSFGKERKKVIYYTGRMKRFIALYILSVVAVLVCLLNYFNPIYYLVAIALSFMVCWVLGIIVYSLLYEIELLIESTVIKKAKMVLADAKFTRIVFISDKCRNKNLLHEMLSSQYHGYTVSSYTRTMMDVSKTILDELKPYHEYCTFCLDAHFLTDVKEIIEMLDAKYIVLDVDSINHKQLSKLNEIETEITLFMNRDLVNAEASFNSNYVVCSSSINGEGDYMMSSKKARISGSRFEVKIGQDNVSFETRRIGNKNLSDLLFGIMIAHRLGIENSLLQKVIRYLSNEVEGMSSIAYNQRVVMNVERDDMDEVKELLRSNKRNKILVITTSKKEFDGMIVNETFFEQIVVIATRLPDDYKSKNRIKRHLEIDIHLTDSLANANIKALELSEANDVIVIVE